jgi:3-methylcrotonyl-CoA carboxylase alpha subunit
MRPQDDGFSLSCGGVETSVEARRIGDRLLLLVNGVKHEVATVVVDDGVVIVLRGGNYLLKWLQTATSEQGRGPSDERLLAPMPATVTHVAVTSGDVVSKGETLVVLEAMKMEIAMAAPHDGVVKSVACAVGDMAKEGAELVTLTRKEGA